MDCGKILDVSIHLLSFSCTIIKRVLALLFVLLMLQRTMLLPSPELKWIGLYRQMCPLPSSRLMREGSSQSLLNWKKMAVLGPIACKIWHNMQNRINTTTEPLWKLKMIYKKKTVIYRSGFQKGIFLCHITIIFNIIRNLMFPFEWTWHKNINKGLISHEVNIYAEVIIRQYKKNVKLNYRWLKR